MTRIMAATALGSWLAVATLKQAAGQDVSAPGAGIAVSADGVPSRTITREALGAMPRVERDVVFMTPTGERRGRYAGVLLRDVLQQAGVLPAGDVHAALRRTLSVTGRDGYAIAFSVGELLPDFGDTPALVALTVDGGPLPAEEGLRLVVPGDRRGARAVYDIVRIELR